MAIYHLTVTHGSRMGDQSAVAKFEYILRRGARRQRTDLASGGSLNMPYGVGAEEFWAACDLYSRANGRLFTEIEFALPKELSRPQQLNLVQRLLSHLSVVNGGTVPMSWGMHDKGDGNVHVHVQLSSRVHDDVPREDIATWFKRANRKEPARGGARSWAEQTDSDWVELLRSRWACLANEALAAAESAQRIDHRSNARRGLELAPTRHVGWRGGRRRNEILAYNRRVEAENENYLEAKRLLRALRAQDALEQLDAARAAAAAEKRRRESNMAEACDDALRMCRFYQEEAQLVSIGENVRQVYRTISLTAERPDSGPEFVVKEGKWGRLYIRYPDDRLEIIDMGSRIKVHQGHDSHTRMATLRLSASRWQEFEVRCEPAARAAWWNSACEMGLQDRLRFADPPRPRNHGAGHNIPREAGKPQQSKGG